MKPTLIHTAIPMSSVRRSGVAGQFLMGFFLKWQTEYD